MTKRYSHGKLSQNFMTQPSKDKELRVGIIGCGNIFPMHARPIANIKGLKLTHVCDIDKTKAFKRAKEYECGFYRYYKEMLRKEKLDCVHILTPHYLHAEMAIQAARHKTNILVEKPMAINPRDASRMINAANKNNVKLGVIYQNRYTPASRLLKENLDNGKLGKIKAIKLVLSYHKPDEYYKKSNWKGTWKKEGGGVLIDQAIHFIDTLRWLVGDDVDYVESHMANRMHKSIEVEDLAEGVIKFKKGAYICFYLINYYSYDDETEIEIDCEKGRVNIIKESARVGLYDGTVLEAKPNPDDYIDYGEEVRNYWGGCHIKQIEDYYRSLREGNDPWIDGHEGKATQDLVWAMYKSARQGKRVIL